MRARLARLLARATGPLARAPLPAEPLSTERLLHTPLSADPPLGGAPPREASPREASPSGAPPSGASPSGATDAGPTLDAPAPAPAPVAGGLARLAGPSAFDPGRRGVKAIAVVACVVVLGAAGWAWYARPRTEPVPVADAAGPSAGPDPARTGGPSPGSAELVVAVAGKVRRPGLVRLPVGARVADALDAAGGVLPGVDPALLNLARKVADGELLLVGVTAPPGVAGVAEPGAGPGGSGPAGAGGGKINLNTATLAQLDNLPGVGPVLAQRILDHREQHGGFRSVGDLRQVQGIGDARYEELKDLVTV